MSGRIVITTPPLSTETVAEVLGVSKTRVRVLTRLMDAIHAGRNVRSLRALTSAPTAPRSRRIALARRKKVSTKGSARRHSRGRPASP